MDTAERQAAVREMIVRRIEACYPGTDDVVGRLSADGKLTFYLGIDPTGTELHVGHTIPLLVLRDLARMGHDAVLLIGDFTARVGDPTGKHSARAALTREEVEENMATYVQQAERIIPRDLFRVVYNSEWLSPMTMEEVLRLTGMVTVQQMIQRDMFQQRLKDERPIHLNEFLYPLMQGYDSVALRTDGEVGGNDQTFNMLMGRNLEREILGKDKMVIATRLLVDAASGKKMSKSEGTLIAVGDSAQEIRRKVLALDDGMVRAMFELCTDIPYATIDTWQRDGELPKQPREAKEALAEELVRMYHGEAAVQEAAEPTPSEPANSLVKFLIDNGAATSATGAKALITQGAVSKNGVTEKNWYVEVNSGDEIGVGKGKRFKAK
jgi:tyrosyl-tRNA synthetase